MPGEDVRGSSLPRFFLDNAVMKARTLAFRLAPLAMLLGGQPAHAADPAFLFSAYKDTTIARDAETGALARLRGDASAPLPGPDALADGIHTLSLAFANGECGEDFNMRWVASLVAEAYRILMRGATITKDACGCSMRPIRSR